MKIYKIAKKDKEYLTPEERDAVKSRFEDIQCSFAKDKDGYYCYTHRARSKSYPSIADIPKSKVDFINSTSSVSNALTKTASTESDVANLKDTIRVLKDDVRDIKKDHRDIASKVKKIDEILDRLNIGKRQISQVQNTFTELQRKVEKFEAMMQEWKNFKKDMNTTVRMEVEKKTRMASSNNVGRTAALKRPQSFYDLYAVSGANKTFIISIPAYSEKQALYKSYSIGRARDYRGMGWTIRAYLNKEKTQENMNKYEQALKYQTLLEEQKKQREEAVQDIYGNSSMKIKISRSQWEEIGKMAGWSTDQRGIIRFLQENKEDLDALIKTVCPNCVIQSDHDRLKLVMSNNELYNWARSRGANI